MPSFKLSGVKAQEVKSGFEPYDGPEPTRKGFYRAKIKSMKHGLNANSGSLGFSIVLELEAAKGDPKDHAIFDGYPMFSRSIITESKGGVALKEGAQNNLQNLLAALGVKDEPDVVLANGDEDKVDVLKIGGKNPLNTVVNVDLNFEMYEGERRPQVGGIYKYNEPTSGQSDKAKFVADDEEDDSDLLDADEEQTEDDGYEERQAELSEMGIPALKKIAKELGVGISGTKAALIERILEAEYAESDEDDEDEDAEDAEEDEEGTEETEETDDDEDEEDEEDDEEEDDEADEEDDEAKAEREAEIAEIARTGLKAILKEIAPDFTILKRHSDDDLRNQIIAVEFAEDLPF